MDERRPDPVRVAAAIITRDGRVLLTRRPAGTHLGLAWEFPGGKVEFGEDLAGCLHRELREELGTTVDTLSPWKCVVYSYPEKRVEIHFFRCRLAGPEPRPIQCPQLAWVGPEELGRFDLLPADREVVPDLAELLRAEASPPGALRAGSV